MAKHSSSLPKPVLLDMTKWRFLWYYSRLIDVIEIALHLVTIEHHLIVSLFTALYLLYVNNASTHWSCILWYWIPIDDQNLFQKIPMLENRPWPQRTLTAMLNLLDCLTFATLPFGKCNVKRTWKNW